MSRREQSGGGLTGATGDLTPDDIQRDFEPGEWREASDPAHHADVTRTQATHVQEHHPLADDADDESDDEREARESRIGGDEQAEGEEHF